MDVRAFLDRVDDLLAEASRLLEDARAQAGGAVVPGHLELEGVEEEASRSGSRSSLPSGYIRTKHVRAGSVSASGSASMLSASSLISSSSSSSSSDTSSSTSSSAGLPEPGSRSLARDDVLRALDDGLPPDPEALARLGLPTPPEGGLATRSSDLPVHVALERLLAGAPEDEAPGGSPRESSSSNSYEALDAPIEWEEPGSVTSSSRSSFSTTTSSSQVGAGTAPWWQEDLARLEAEDPALGAKVRKALLKHLAAAQRDEVQAAARRRAKLGDVAPGVSPTTAQAKLNSARSRLARKVQDTEDSVERDLFLSSEALRQRPEDVREGDTFQSMHQGEHREYFHDGLAGDQILGGAKVQLGKLRGEGYIGEELGTVSTRALSDEERDEVEVRGGEGLRRKDGSLVDTSEARQLVMARGSSGSGEIFVVSPEGKLLMGAQDGLSRNVDAWKAASLALFRKTGRRSPKNREEARAFGFPTDVEIAHHSTFLGGGDVSTGGQIDVDEGLVRRVTNDSGHYQPHAESTFRAVAVLDDLGGVVKHLGPGHTKVDVLHDGGREAFDGIVVLAAGADLARARELQAVLDETGRLPPEVARQTQVFEEMVTAHAERTEEARKALDEVLLAAQQEQAATLRRLDARVEATRAVLEAAEDEEARGALATTLDELLAEHDDAVRHLKQTRKEIEQRVRELEGSLAVLEAELLEAGAAPEAVEGILRAQKRGVGVLNLAQIEFVSWMQDLVGRRKELAKLRELAGDEGFRERKREARKKLEALFGARSTT